MTIRVLRQLLKEFWFPLLGSAAWVLFSVPWGQHSVAGSIARFMPALFFLSWLLGQFFRVSKQARTEASLGAIERRLNEVTSGLETAAEATIGYATGGDSWAYFLPTLVEDGRGPEGLFAIAQGRYPVFDLVARIADLERLAEVAPGVVPSTGQIIRIGNINTRYGLQIDTRLDLHGRDRRFNVFFSARNGLWVQKLRYRFDGERWFSAYKVERYPHENEVAILTCEIPENFPDADSIDWG